MVIMEKGNLPHPRCTRYGMFLRWGALNIIHPDTYLCAKGADHNQYRMGTE